MNQDWENRDKPKNGSNILEPLYVFFTKAFKYFNTHVFDNILPNMVLLIQLQKPRARLRGYFSAHRFKVNNNSEPLITLVVDWINDSNVIDQLEVLIHEMIHFEAKVKMIDDTSRTQFHREAFRKIGESRGYIIQYKDKKYGWSFGKANEQLLKVFNDFLKNNPYPFQQFETIKYETPKKERTIFNFVCYECGVVIKGKRDTDAICGTCNVPFEFVEPKPPNPTIELSEKAKKILDEWEEEKRTKEILDESEDDKNI